MGTLRAGLGLVLAGSFTSMGAGQQPTLQSVPAAAPATNTANARLAEAHRLMAAGQFAQAESLLRSELRDDPRSPEANEQLAYCLLREDRPKDALDQYTKAAALRKPDASGLVNVGQAYVLLGDMDDADQWTLRAVRMSPGDANAWYSLGRIRYTEQRFADAVSCFQRVLQITPGSAKAENNLGLAEEGLNRQDEAAVAYRQAIAWENGASGPGAEQPYLNLAIVLLHRGGLDEAGALLDRAVQISPNDPRIYEQIGHVRLQKKDTKGAAEAFSKGVQLDPKNSSLHFMLGQTYRRLGQMTEAQTEFAEAERLHAQAASGKP